MLNTIKVLDKGYVRLVDKLGSDLTPVNAARVSFNKESKEFNEKDEMLVKFLIENDHTSPFRHAAMQFEIYAPLMVARQWWKYIIGSSHQEGCYESLNAWNESSRRYITEEIVFYVPQEDAWRSMPENMKQGSGDNLDVEIGSKLREKLFEQIDYGMKNYDWAVENGVATEQARLFLPSAYGLYVRWYWTASLQSVLHFLEQRLAEHAQYEIRCFAKAVEDHLKNTFPVCYKYYSK